MSQTPLITDASPSADEQQARRRRTYSIIMIVHIVGFAASYPCYLLRPWAGVVVIGVTGLLPWVAVILANDAPRRSGGGSGPRRLLERGARGLSHVPPGKRGS